MEIQDHSCKGEGHILIFIGEELIIRTRLIAMRQKCLGIKLSEIWFRVLNSLVYVGVSFVHEQSGNDHVSQVLAVKKYFYLYLWLHSTGF